MRFICLILALLSTSVHAADDRVVREIVRRHGYEAELVERYKTTGCGEAGSTAQNICVLYGSVEADLALNDTYRELLVKLKGTSARAKLVAAQKAWVQFRDASCKYESDGSTGGMDYATVFNSCISEQTTIRLKALQEYSSCSDAGCPGVSN
jgi:uncharacterized protein YecT (DUF1311 family)